MTELEISCIVIAGWLSDTTAKQVLDDLRNVQGQEVSALRKAISDRRMIRRTEGLLVEEAAQQTGETDLAECSDKNCTNQDGMCFEGGNPCFSPPNSLP